MAILTLKLDTETGHIEYDYPEKQIREDHPGGSDVDGVPPIIVNGGYQGYLSGNTPIVTGWNLNIQVGKLPEERERQHQMGRLLKWRDRQREVLNQPDFTGVDKEKLEGAIEMCDLLLNEMGYTEDEPVPDEPGEPEPDEPNDSADEKEPSHDEEGSEGDSQDPG
jgi:hypothetical protein